MISVLQPLLLLYRLLLTFGIGFLCCALVALNLTQLFSTFWPKAESVFLAGFCALIFYTCFVICAFCTPHIKRFSVISFALLFGLFLLEQSIG
ncbi:hypothetical protein B9T34_15835 [Acinetobacter sp. ANC 3813]|nr:hypothetical protein B9T34_15835 [Acinetobacter sp. ANC 3813]